MPTLKYFGFDWFCYVVPPVSQVGYIERKEECDHLAALDMHDEFDQLSEMMDENEIVDFLKFSEYFGVKHINQ